MAILLLAQAKTNSHENDVASLAICRNGTGRRWEPIRIDNGFLHLHEFGDSFFQLQMHVDGAIETAWSTRTYTVFAHTCNRTLFDVGRAQQPQIIVRAHVETVDAIDCDSFANGSADDALLKDWMIHVNLIDQRLWDPSINYRCFFLQKQGKTLQVMITIRFCVVKWERLPYFIW